MKFIEYSHRHADAIIANDCVLRKRYKEFTDALESISEEDLIKDYNKRKKAHNEKHTAFKSITPSINGSMYCKKNLMRCIRRAFRIFGSLS